MLTLFGAEKVRSNPGMRRPGRASTRPVNGSTPASTLRNACAPTSPSKPRTALPPPTQRPAASFSDT